MSLPKVTLVEERRYVFKCAYCHGSTRLPITWDMRRDVKCRSCQREYSTGKVYSWEDRSQA